MPPPSKAFLTHLSFFASPTHPHLLTIPSSLRSALSLGLNFPASLLLSLALRFMYTASPMTMAQPNLQTLDVSRTQLEHATLTQPWYSRSELLALAPKDSNIIDRGHVIGLWALAADPNTGRVSRRDVEEFQKGTLLKRLQERRRIGRDDVIPFLRGGPGNVAGHSWVVWKLFGVQVYAAK